MAGSSFQGARYLTEGFRLITVKGIRPFVFIPLIINLTLLSIALIYMANKLDGIEAGILETLNEWLPDWLDWLITGLSAVLWPLMFLSLLVIVFYFFSMLANWIAAPFNGLLAEAVENHLHGKPALPEQSWGAVIKDVPRLLGREFRKLRYWIPRALACLILLLIPGLGLIFPLVWFVFNAWMMAIQYVDYPMDNHKIPFGTMLEALRSKRSGMLGFGAAVMALTLVPVVNLLIMPVAVCGATKLWYEQMRPGLITGSD